MTTFATSERAPAPADISNTEPLLDGRRPRTYFDRVTAWSKRWTASASALQPGETLAIVAVRCGKSITALSLMRLVPDPPGRIAGGSVKLAGLDLLTLSAEAMRGVRGKHRDDLPGADDLAQSGAHHRQPDRGSLAAARADQPAAGGDKAVDMLR